MEDNTRTMVLTKLLISLTVSMLPTVRRSITVLSNSRALDWLRAAPRLTPIASNCATLSDEMVALFTPSARAAMAL